MLHRAAYAVLHESGADDRQLAHHAAAADAART
jgi:hypothetical protein